MSELVASQSDDDPSGAGVAARVVLVVEDDRAVARMLRIAMRSAGFEVIEARTGADALARASGAKIDAVVLDLGLPDGGAGNVLTWLRAKNDRMPWLVISALDQHEAARQYGQFDGHFVAKPFDPWMLVRRLEDQLSR